MSEKERAKDYNDTPNDGLGVNHYADGNGHKDKKKKRKLQLDLTEDGKKDGRDTYERETSVSGAKERKKNKMGSKSGLELDGTGKESGGLKDKKTEDVSDATEVVDEKEKKKDKKKKKRDKHDADHIVVDEVLNDPLTTGKEKANKDSNALDIDEVSEVGYEEKNKKKKDRKSKEDANDVKKVGKGSKKSKKTKIDAEEKSRKGKRTEGDAEGSGLSEAASKDELNSGTKIINLQASDTAEKNKKKRKKSSDDSNVELQGSGNEEKKKKKKKKGGDDVGVGLQASAEEQNGKKKKKGSDDLGVGSHESKPDKPVDASREAGDNNQGKKKKAKSDKKVEKVPKTKMSDNSTEKEARRRVSFSDQVEVFPLSYSQDDEENAHKGGSRYSKDAGKDGLVRGKRFSPEEDEMLKKAVLGYIEHHNLGEEGVDKVLHCKNHKELKNCWKEIGASLPWRPHMSVYYRGHILFERDESKKWTADDYELVRKFHGTHGSDWRTLGDALGKHRIHVKDTWRRIKLPNMKSGQWSQDEYQTLFNLVNMDLRMKADEERLSKHGMLRDNICWTSISDKLSTRTDAFCCTKWYNQLTSSMVAEGSWSDTDDYRLLDALQDLDACSMEDVDWDCLIENRPGDVCRKRWNQMVNHLGYLGIKSFAEQVEVLAQRYCVDVLEAREAYDSRTPIDIDT